MSKGTVLKADGSVDSNPVEHSVTFKRVTRDDFEIRLDGVLVKVGDNKQPTILVGDTLTIAIKEEYINEESN